MENIKSFDTIKEAMAYKPIWPEYDLQYDNYRAGMQSWIRKANDKGEWYLIPVRMTWEFSDRDKTEETEVNDINQVKQLLIALERFVAQCHRVQLYYIVPEDEAHITDVRGHKIEELDKDQRTEQERLKLVV